MPSNVVINWSQPVDIDGAHYPKDTLGREKYAQHLSNFLASKGYDETRGENDRKRNYVLNLNSEWGSGKTYFLKRWAEDLKAHHPVVYVDAWQQDYSDDPLMAVISSMINQLRDQAGKSAKDAKFKAPRKLLGLLKAAAPAVAGGLAKRYLGIDPVKIMESSEEGHIGETVKDEKGNEIDMGTAASKIVSHLIDEHSAKSEAIESLKDNIGQWIEAVKAYKSENSDERKQYPAFVFIDELDRCRPSYAVEMLETIKHIFNIKGVVFVVATDTDQLQHAVKAIYGEGFNADVYLGRFFDARYTLREADYEALLFAHCDMNKITSQSMLDKEIRVWPKCSTISNEVKNLATIYHGFNLSAREAIQLTERLISVIENLKQGCSLNLCYLAILMCMKEKKPTQFNKFQHWEEQFVSLDMNAKRTLVFHVYPKDFFDAFFIHEDSFGTTRVNNSFQAQNVELSVGDFLRSLHPTFMTWIDPNTDYSTLANVASSGSWECKTADYATDWLSYGNVLNTLCADSHDEAIEKFKIADTRNRSPEFLRYKDLVELSTALDV